MDEETKVEVKPSMSDEKKAKIRAGLERYRAQQKAEKEAAAAKRAARTAPPSNLPPKIDQSEVSDLSTASWRPARITDIPDDLKRPDREYHFFLDNPNSIRKRQMEQWHIDTEIAAKMGEQFGARTLAQGTTIDGAYRVNELILMWMPKATAAARSEYFRRMSDIDAETMKRKMQDQIPDSRPNEKQVYTKNPMAPAGHAEEMNRVERISAIN